MNSKWLRFLLLDKTNKTSFWRVENKGGEELGFIKWYPQWRQYCFISHSSVVYSQSCLEDIAEFIKKLMDERRRNK